MDTKDNKRQIDVEQCQTIEQHLRERVRALSDASEDAKNSEVTKAFLQGQASAYCRAAEFLRAMYQPRV